MSKTGAVGSKEPAKPLVVQTAQNGDGDPGIDDPEIGRLHMNNRLQDQ